LRASRKGARRPSAISSTGNRNSWPFLRSVFAPLGAYALINADIACRLVPVRSFALIAVRSTAAALSVRQS
jgi:hypothetical protein